MSLDQPANEIVFCGGEPIRRDKTPVALVSGKRVSARDPLIVSAPTQQTQLWPCRYFDRLKREPCAQLLSQVGPLGDLAQRCGECLGDHDLTGNQPLPALAQALLALGQA